MERFDEEMRRRLAAVYAGVAHRYRIAILTGLVADQSLPEIADAVGTTRGTLQHHVEKLIESDLVARRDTAFVVTPLGRYVLQVLGDTCGDLASVFDVLDDAEGSVEEELAPAADVLDDDEWERKLHTRKWEQVWDEIEQRLEQ